MDKTIERFAYDHAMFVRQLSALAYFALVCMRKRQRSDEPHVCRSDNPAFRLIFRTKTWNVSTPHAWESDQPPRGSQFHTG